MGTLTNAPLPGLEDPAHDQEESRTQPEPIRPGRSGAAPRSVRGLRQCRIIVTPWASGHCTVDVIARVWDGTDHWDRRSGHLDLDVSGSALAGLSARELLALLAAAPLR